jgi:hypothetical protein
MHAAIFFIAPRQTDADLADVASAVFDALGISEWEERDSSNYPPDGHYYAGYCQNAKVKVYDGDDDRTLNYPFHVLVEDSSWRKGRGVIITDAASVSKALVGAGYTVFIPHGDWHRTDWNGEGDVYTA